MQKCKKPYEHAAFLQKRKEWKVIDIKYADYAEGKMPIEEALMAFLGTSISRGKIEKGIPLVSFVVKEGGDAVYLKPHPLFLADEILKGRVQAGHEVLYRADYIRGGTEKSAVGVLTAGVKPERFLKLMGQNAASGNEKADAMGIYGYLEAHLTLCGLEGLAEREISFMEKEEAGSTDYREANRAYYREILSYVETGRRYLNSSMGFFLPPFPSRSAFMAGWYGKHKGKG
jgi:hypothetical protein